MSTKIYTGFKFNKKFSLNQLQKIFVDFRNEVENLVEEEVYKFIAKRATELFDEFTLGLTEKDPDSPFLLLANREISNRKMEMDRTNRRDPEIDFGFEIVIYPLRNKILGTYYGENERIIDSWMNKSFIDEYHYQNQTDEPEGMCEKEWKQRELDWDKALCHYSGIPNMCGFCINITKQYYPFASYRDVVKYIPKLDERAKPFAEDSLYEKKFDFFKKKREKEIYGGKKKSDKKLKLSDLSKVYFSYRNWLKTKEGKKAFNKEMKNIKKKLKTRISKKDLI